MTKKIDAISKRAAEILSKAYTRRLVPDETGGYVASIQEFPGCIAEGDAADEAIQNLDKAAMSWIEVALGNGYEIREPASFLGCSGKIALRLPRGLHKQVAELAELEECSVNNLLVTAISEYLGRNVAIRKLSDAVCSEIRQIVSDGLVSLYRYGPAEIVIRMPVLGNGYFSGGTTFEGQLRKETYTAPYRVTQTGAQLLESHMS